MKNKKCCLNCKFGHADDSYFDGEDEVLIWHCDRDGHTVWESDNCEQFERETDEQREG